MKKKVIVYGAADCPECVALKARLDEEDISYGYVDILQSLAHLKKFMVFRDAHPQAFINAVSLGAVGIPAVAIDDREVYVADANGWDMDIFR